MGKNTYEKQIDWKMKRLLVIKRDNFKCQFCKGKQRMLKQLPPNELDCHHIIPQALGGTDDLENLITICKNCHQKENKKLEIILKEFRLLKELSMIYERFDYNFLDLKERLSFIIKIKKKWSE